MYQCCQHVKTYNRNLYRKLDVDSFDELKVYIELFASRGRSGELLRAISCQLQSAHNPVRAGLCTRLRLRVIFEFPGQIHR